MISAPRPPDPLVSEGEYTSVLDPTINLVAPSETTNCAVSGWRESVRRRKGIDDWICRIFKVY